jgi:hypothetical protein
LKISEYKLILYIFMSYAHYFVKNFKLKEVIDLFCYSTRFPHTLTSTQKITRLYR